MANSGAIWKTTARGERCSSPTTDKVTQTFHFSLSPAKDSLRQQTGLSALLEEHLNWRCDFDYRLQSPLNEQVSGLSRLKDILSTLPGDEEADSGVLGLAEVDRALREARGELKAVRGRCGPVEGSGVALVTELLVATSVA